MRVVAGTARGRRLVTPPGDDVRPTLDRVRESVFNSLGSLDALRSAVVLDAFAGSGALGIEALSRGAARATFVDPAPAALDSVRSNLRSTDLWDLAEVVPGDVLDLLSVAAVPGRAPDGVALAGPFDLVLADPPYAFDRWPELLTSLGPRLADGALVVAESDRELGDELVAVLDELGGTILRERRYGGTVVAMISFQGQSPTGDPEVDPT